jgi:hypothetical protein
MFVGLQSPIITLGSVDNPPQFDWKVVVEKSGSANVAVAITTGGQDSLTLYVPKTYQNFQIVPTLNYTLSPLNGDSYDELRVECEKTDQFNLSYVWPDGAVQYNGRFYFAGQEKPYVQKGKITLSLPKASFVYWIEGYDHFSGNTTSDLTFAVDSLQAIPSFSYTFPNMTQNGMVSRTSKHVTLAFYPIMEGKPWIDKAIEIIENQWNWMKNILEGTINQVNITFAPYGYSDLGTKKSGLCYYDTRNIEIAATNQFGIGFVGWNTALLLHEVTHALTPWLGAFPSFYSEAIAQDFSYEALRRTEVNASADSLEEIQFTSAYEQGVQKGLIQYIYDWQWGNEIYDNATISDACYGTATFIGDYFVHRWGYDYYQKLIAVFNSTEMGSLSNAQKLPKFFEHVSVACGCNATQVLDTVPYMITRWFDAYLLRNEFSTYLLDSNGPFTESAQGTIDAMIKNATEEYDARDFESAINKFNQVKEYADNLQNQDASYWRDQTRLWQNVALLEIVIFAGIVLLVFWLYRRKLRVVRSRYHLYTFIDDRLSTNTGRFK